MIFNVDNGLEFLSGSLSSTCTSLGIHLQYSPHFTPWQKGKVERFHRAFNRGGAQCNSDTTIAVIDSNGDATWE